MRIRTIVVGAAISVTATAALADAHPTGAGFPAFPNERVSVSSAGAEADGASGAADVTSDGRYVVFSSAARNLVRGDGNGIEDVFLRDRRSGTTTRVSVAGRKGDADGPSSFPALSDDGRYIAFQSAAANLVSGDDNQATDVFVYDVRAGTTKRVSVASDGGQANAVGDQPAISADGCYVSFRSTATNLVEGDTNGFADAFVHDRRTGRTTRVSLSSEGEQAMGHSFATSVSADGRYVAFDSGAPNLAPGDLNGGFDAFVHDRRKGITTRVTVSTTGAGADGSGGWPDISADGRYVAFTSNATNLVPGDTNVDINGRNAWDIFVHDLQTRRTTRVSVASSGGQANSRSTQPAISPDGRYVTFTSYASNLVPGDADALVPDPVWGLLDLDYFVHDRGTGATQRVNLTNRGQEAEGTRFTAGFPRLADRGRSVVFTTTATNLVPRDTNDAADVFSRKVH